MSHIDAIDVSQEACIRGWGEPNKAGYLRVSLDNKVHYAHRLAYIAANGAIPLGLHVHHLCDNKSCINPLHLVAITQEQHFSIHTKPKSADYYANLQYCKSGHEFDGEYIRKSGQKQRTCSKCRRKTSREWARSNRNKGENRVSY